MRSYFSRAFYLRVIPTIWPESLEQATAMGNGSTLSVRQMFTASLLSEGCMYLTIEYVWSSIYLQKLWFYPVSW